MATGERLNAGPVTKANLDRLVALFEAPGGPSHCWCSVWRDKRKAARQRWGEDRREALLNRVRAGVPVGLIAERSGKTVGWVSLGPKDSFCGLGGLEPAAGEVVWSLTCLYVPRALRGQGLSRQLVAAAVAEAREAGATVLEAYPVDADSPSYRFMGFTGLYQALGFRQIGRAGSRRHVMRLPL